MLNATTPISIAGCDGLRYYTTEKKQGSYCHRPADRFQASDTTLTQILCSLGHLRSYGRMIQTIESFPCPGSIRLCV